MVYVVMVQSVLNGEIKVSQEGYKTLKEAQDFVSRRGDSPKKYSNLKYYSLNYVYTIYEVNVKGSL